MQRTIIKLFLASPGDLVEERKAAKRIVDEENRNHAIPQGFQLELVGWEDTVAQHGRAQEVINRDLDQCNYFIGLLWKRWGSPPGPQDGPYSSGFEEEYERSEKRFKSTGKPSISMLFKSVSSAEISDAGPQLKKVLEFKRTFTDDYRGVYHTFDDIREFEDRFRSILALFLRNEAAENTKVEAEESSKTPETSSEPQKQKSDRGEMLFEADAKEFVSDLFARPSDPKDYEYTAVEAARLRLLATTLKRSENDEAVIGVHDANLLFREFKDAEISKREIRGLLAAGLNYFGSQNAPLWAWLWNVGNSPLREAALRTIVGSDTQRKYAFEVLALFSEDLPEMDGGLDREDFVRWWLNNKENDLVAASLKYLGRRGVFSDIEQIDPLLESSETTISKAAVSAKIGILSREGAETALDFISKQDDAEISDSVSDLLLARPEAIRTELLRGCLSNQSTDFRRKVAHELLSRGELSLENGKLLVESSDAQTRALGSQAIRIGSSSYSLSDAKAHIVKPKKQNALSLFSLGGRDFEGEAVFERYKHEVLCNRQQSELQDLLASESLYTNDITLALYDKCFSKFRSHLIRNLEDGFSTFLEVRTRQFDQSAAPDKKLADFIRQNMVQQAVELLARKNSQHGLTAIRNAIDRGGIEYADSIVQFFAKKGSWEDVPRLIRLCENFPSLGMSLLSFVSRREEYELSAKAILKLGKNRIADLLTINMPTELWNSVIKSMSKASFISFDDERITEWLRDEIESKRKTVALKSVICLPKSRVEKLLSLYTFTDETYYYNAVCWLDLGVSVDRVRAVQFATLEISQR